MKILLSISLLLLLIIGCSKDDGLEPSTFSNLRLNGEPFVPTPNHGKEQNIFSTITPGDSVTPHGRTFNIRKRSETVDQSIFITMQYPDDQEGADGEYSLLPEDNLGIRTMSVGFMNATSTIPLTSGSVTVNELGNSRYKLTFNNAAGNSGGVETLLTGYFDGAFITDTIN